MTTEPRPFGFQVRLPRHFNDEGMQVPRPGSDDWTVSLPHQCDRWEIAGNGWNEGEPHADAVAELERFIAEAQDALAALRERREIGVDE